MLTKEPSWLALEARQVPARLGQIIRRALRKEKEDRYQSVEEMLADLHRLKKVSESVTSGSNRHKKIAAFLAASVAVALVVAGLLQTHTATTEKRFVVRADEKLTAFYGTGISDQ